MAYKHVVFKMKNVECNFCRWTGKKSDLGKNGHCPGCQSPSTKRYDCKHKKRDSISGPPDDQTQKCKDCLTIIYLKHEKPNT